MKLRETVVDINGNYKWLVQEEIIESPDSNDISVKNLDFENPKPLPVKKVYKLLDPNLLECQKCHAIVPMNKGITPPLCPEEYGGCGRKSVFAVYTPEPLIYWKPIPCYSVKLEPEDASLLYDIVKLIKQCIVFDSEIEYSWLINNVLQNSNENFLSVFFDFKFTSLSDNIASIENPLTAPVLI